MWKKFTIYLQGGDLVVELDDGKVIIERYHKNKVCFYDQKRNVVSFSILPNSIDPGGLFVKTELVGAYRKGKLNKLTTSKTTIQKYF